MQGIAATDILCHEECNDATRSACAAQAMIDDGKLELLQEMYASWPFFSVTLDMVEMVRPLLHAVHPGCIVCIPCVGCSALVGMCGNFTCG